MSEIEISFEVKATVSGRFWVDRDEWAALSPDEKASRLEAFVDASNRAFDRNEVDVGDGSVYVHAVGVDHDFGVYDPDAERGGAG